MSARRVRRPRVRRARTTAAVRRGLLLGLATLPLVALVALVAVKLITMSLFAQLAVWFTEAGDHKAALTVSQWNLTANYFQPYKANYNVGTAMLNLELYDDARDYLTYTLTLDPPVPDSCWVRTNLSLAVEGQGDIAESQERFDTAALYYAQAKAYLEAADPACASESSSEDQSEEESEGGGGGGEDEESQGGGGGGGGEDSESGGGGTFGEQSAESQERLGEKQSQAETDLQEQQEQQQQEQQEQEQEQQGGGGGSGESEEEQEGEGGAGGAGGEDGETPGQAGNPFDDLGERMEQAERQRQRGTGIERSESGSNPYPDKPW